MELGAVDRLVLQAERLVLDTVASLKRFLISLAFLVLAVLLGLYMGLFPLVNQVFHFFVLLNRNTRTFFRSKHDKYLRLTQTYSAICVKDRCYFSNF